MQNTKHNNVKKALLNKAHVKRWRRILLCLSCVVVFCTVYALILPAITLEKTAAEEHIHTEECYSNNGTLLCNLSEDSYEEENTLIQETDSTLPDSITDNEEEDVTDYTEIVSSTDAYVLPDEKISSLQLTYTKENKKVSISNNGVLDTPDTLDVDMVVSFEKLALSELKERSFIYTLPDAFLITDTSSRNITIADQIIGTYSPKVNGQVTVQYTQEYLNTLNDSVTMKGTFTLSTRIDLDKVDLQTGRIKVPQGNITLDLGKDYLEHYGSVTSTKSCSKKDKDNSSEYLQYTLTVTADAHGSKNVYVVDKFIESSEAVKYVGIPQGKTQLSSTTDGLQPFETITGNDTAVAGTIYFTITATDTQKIPEPVSVSTSIAHPGSFVWKIDEMKPLESRTLTYYVKLADEGGKIKTENNQSIKNQAKVYAKGDTIYHKHSAEATFQPRIYYEMNTNVQRTRDDSSGKYIFTYTLDFKLQDSTNYPLKNFVFWDYLNATDGNMHPYISYTMDSVKLYEKKKGQSNYSEVTDRNLFDVWWAASAGDYTKNWNSSDGHPLRLKVQGSNNHPILVNPGDAYRVTYEVEISPEVYAVMPKKENNQEQTDIKNKFFASCQNACERNDWGMIHRNEPHSEPLRDYTWVNKTKAADATTVTKMIPMGDSKVYDLNGNPLNEGITQFEVIPGSYAYTVEVNKTCGQFDVTDSIMTDTFSPSEMIYIGYVKVTAHDELNNTDVNFKWIKVDGRTSFSFKPSDFGWGRNTYSYRLEYYGKPRNLNEISQVIVNNTFTLDKAQRNGNVFTFGAGNERKSSQQVSLTGLYKLDVTNNGWYYERPLGNANTYQNGTLYWVVTVKGSMIRGGTSIMDKVSRESGQNDFVFKSDSFVGVYQGNLDNEYLRNHHLDDFASLGLDNLTHNFSTKFTNDKNYPNGYSELIVTANTNLAMGEAKNLYIVVKSEPKVLPATYRSIYSYKNEVHVKEPNDTGFRKCGDSTLEIYGGADILKELGQTFYYDGQVRNIDRGADNGDTSKIISNFLPENKNGLYVSWAFKLNYSGELQGDYRVLEDIPDGMDLAYMRIKWHGTQTEQIKSTQIDGLEENGWVRETNESRNENDEPQDTFYYVKDKQAIIQLGSFTGKYGRDVYSVDVQVVCKVTDPKVLLSGESKTFTNKVTLLNQDGTKVLATASSNATLQRNSLDKQHTIDGRKIHYTITANTLGQNLPSNIQDEKNITLVDELGDNLELDVTTIAARDTSGVDVLVSKSYNSSNNTLEITIPKDKKVLITYDGSVEVAPEAHTSVTNYVYWKNYSKAGGVNDVINDFSYTLNSGGTSTGLPTLVIQKMDQDTLEALKDVSFTVQPCTLNDDGSITDSDIAVQNITDEKGKIHFTGLNYNQMYKVTETITPDGYVVNDKPYYILCVNTKDSSYDETYIEKCKNNANVSVVYDASDFKLQIMNVQKGITVKKTFINDAAGKYHNPVSGTYWFGVYDNSKGTGTFLEKISITYLPGETTEKTAKFKNRDLNTSYYVFELDQFGNPISASATEATINNLQYSVEYSNNNISTNAAKVGDTVTVTNQSRTKILPSTGSNGIIRYKIAGSSLLLLAGLLMINVLKQHNFKN